MLRRRPLKRHGGGNSRRDTSVDVDGAASPEVSYPPTGRPNGRPMTGSSGYPVRRSFSFPSLEHDALELDRFAVSAKH